MISYSMSGEASQNKVSKLSSIDSICLLQFVPLDFGDYHFVRDAKETMFADLLKINRRMQLGVSSLTSGDVFGFGVFVEGAKKSALLQGGFVVSARA
jgi:hypothetical protein